MPMIILSALILGSTVSALPAAAPLPATGKWVVDHADTGCTLTHGYGPADASMVVTLRPILMGRSVLMSISSLDASYADREDQGTLRVEPGDRVLPVKMTSYGPVTGGHRLTRFWIEDVAIDSLITADALTLDRGRVGSAISFAPKGSTKAVAALQTCQDSALKEVGIDPDAQRSLTRLASPVGGSEAKWFKPSDYPKAARGNYRGGRATARVTIAANGTVTECTVVESAGNPDLDDATCRILRERGLYEPALDAGGKPTAAPKLVGVRWTMSR